MLPANMKAPPKRAMAQELEFKLVSSHLSFQPTIAGSFNTSSAPQGHMVPEYTTNSLRLVQAPDTKCGGRYFVL